MLVLVTCLRWCLVGIADVEGLFPLCNYTCLSGGYSDGPVPPRTSAQRLQSPAALADGGVSLAPPAFINQSLVY